MLVTLTIFAAEGGDGAAGSVVVAMIDADGRYVGDEDVDGRVIGVVAALALASARSDRERGPEPWVRVAGSPTGAIVRIDGREVGVVPFEGRVTAGEHSLEVGLGGYETFTRRFTARNGSTEAIDVALTGSGTGGEGDGDVLEVAGIATSATIAGAGAVMIGIGAAWLSVAGSCASGASTPPCDGAYYTPDSGGIMLGVGVGTLVVAGTVAILLVAID